MTCEKLPGGIIICGPRRRLTNAEIDQLRELYLERASIKEYEGNMPREQAEREAREEVYGGQR